MRLPDYGLFAYALQIGIGLREVAAAEKTAIDRQRRGVYGAQYAVARGVGYGSLALGIAAPEHVDDIVLMQADGTHHGIGELLPAVSGMRGGLVGTHRQYGIEQQHALLGPTVEVAACGYGGAGIVVHLLEDVLQRGRKGHAVAHREAQTVGLTLAVIGILAYDDHFQIVESTLVECTEYVTPLREYAVCGILLANESHQVGEIGFIELLAYDCLPVFGYAYIHTGNYTVFRLRR